MSDVVEAELAEELGEEATREYAESGLDPVQSEVLDDQSSLPTYEILTYPADWTLEVLVDKWRKGQIAIPKFQRHFVWSQVQASKLIESFLLGLPVPAIFLYSDPEDPTHLVVDGQQRIKSIGYYFEGAFGEETQGRRTVFRLKGLDDKSPYAGLTYGDLEQKHPAAFAKLNDSVLRAFIIKQLDPADNTSVYLVFERLNTGGTTLTQQEIRNCIHEGPFNDLLLDLNRNSDWRAIFGTGTADKRQRDVELVLRFLALRYSVDSYEKPMKNFLNEFMRRHRWADDADLTEYAAAFEDTAAAVSHSLGDHPFHIRNGLNAAVYDSVFVAFAAHVDSVPSDIAERYDSLVDEEEDNEFLSWVSVHTTDRDTVANRLQRANDVLFG